MLQSHFSEEDYYLLVIGRRHGDNKEFYLSSFHNLCKKAVCEGVNFQELEEEESETFFQEQIKGPFEKVLSSYQYFYIPVETDPVTYTKLETTDMQSLVGARIQDDIERAIDAEALKNINSALENFVSKIEKKLKDYKYKAKQKKDKLSKKDIVKKTIEVYFSIKTLHKKIDSKHIPVSELSSGGKKKVFSGCCARIFNSIGSTREIGHSCYR